MSDYRCFSVDEYPPLRDILMPIGSPKDYTPTLFFLGKAEQLRQVTLNNLPLVPIPYHLDAIPANVQRFNLLFGLDTVTFGLSQAILTEANCEYMEMTRKKRTGKMNLNLKHLSIQDRTGWLQCTGVYSYLSLEFFGQCYPNLESLCLEVTNNNDLATSSEAFLSTEEMDTIVREFCKRCRKLKMLRLQNLDISNDHQIHLLGNLPMLQRFHFQPPNASNALSANNFYRILDICADMFIQHLSITVCISLGLDGFFSHILSNPNIKTLQIRIALERQQLNVCTILNRFSNLTILGFHTMDVFVPSPTANFDGYHPIHTLQFIETSLHCSAIENLSQYCPYIRSLSICNNCINQLIELPRHKLQNVDVRHNLENMPKNIVVATFMIAWSGQLDEDTIVLPARDRFYELGNYTIATRRPLHMQAQYSRDELTDHRPRYVPRRCYELMHSEYRISKYLQKLEGHRGPFFYEESRTRQITWKAYKDLIRTGIESKIRTFALYCASVENLTVDGYSICC